MFVRQQVSGNGQQNNVRVVDPLTGANPNISNLAIPTSVPNTTSNVHQEFLPYGKLKIAHINVAGWTKKNMSSKSLLLRGINAVIVGLSETHLNDENANNLEVDGYKTIHHNLRIRKEMHHLTQVVLLC